MTHRQTTDEIRFRPSRKVIDTRDNYKSDDYLTAASNERCPQVGTCDSSPTRGKRHVTVINPYEARTKAEEERKKRTEAHNVARSERTRQLEDRQQYAKGFGGHENFVPSKKKLDGQQMDKEVNARMRKEARYYTDPVKSSNSNPQQYSSNIGYVKFDYSGDQPVSYGGSANDTRDEMPRSKGIARRPDAFSSNGNLLVHDPETAPRNVSPRKQNAMVTQQQRNTNIITNQPVKSDAPSTPLSSSPRKQAAVNYERRYQRDTDLISNQPLNYGSASAQPSPPAANSRFAARHHYNSKNSHESPFSHHDLLSNVPTAGRR
jgi:RNA recognition motif-containing protein